MEASGKVANGIGQPVRRKEDFRLLTGRGRFGDDVTLPGLAHAVIERSPHAHARIASVDKRAALAAPGVLAVVTGADYAAAQLGPIPHNPGLSAPPDIQARLRGGAPIATRHHPLPADRARFVGEPVALVVAETIGAAKDAAELVEIAWEPLSPVVRAADAIVPGAPILWDEAPDNVCIDLEVGDAAATARAFARAAQVVRLETWAQRVTGVPMEPAPMTPNTTRRPANIRFTPGAGAESPRSGSTSPRYSGWRPSKCACCATTWAGISARATCSTLNMHCSPGRRASSGDRSNGLASAASHLSATGRAAT
jgi:CO/xanthine dehydrogenase Mo-binding subunit